MLFKRFPFTRIFHLKNNKRILNNITISVPNIYIIKHTWHARYKNILLYIFTKIYVKVYYTI